VVGWSIFLYEQEQRITARKREGGLEEKERKGEGGMEPMRGKMSAQHK
jgi:hypothetical protein